MGSTEPKNPICFYTGPPAPAATRPRAPSKHLIDPRLSDFSRAYRTLRNPKPVELPSNSGKPNVGKPGGPCLCPP